MAERGFIASNAAVTAIGNTFALAKVILMDGAGTDDARAKKLPRDAKWEYVWLRASALAGGAAAASLRLYWDSTCDVPIFDQSLQVNLITGLTTAADGGCAFPIGVQVSAPSDATVDAEGLNIWGVLKTDAGTLTCDKLQLIWSV